MRPRSRIQKLSGWVAFLFCLGMFYTLIPDRATRSQLCRYVSHIPPGEEISMEAAREQGQAMLAEAQAHKADYPAEMHVRHQERFYEIGKRTRERGRLSNMPLFLRFYFDECVNIFQRQPRFRGEYHESMYRLAQEHKLFEKSQFVPEDAVWNFRPALLYVFWHYLYTIPLAFAYQLALLVWRRKPILPELVCPDRLLRSSILWFCFFWYETREPREQFRLATRRFAYAFSTAFAFIAGGAPAYAQKPCVQDPLRGENSHTLYLDGNSLARSGNPPLQKPDPAFTPKPNQGGEHVLVSISTRNKDRYFGPFVGDIFYDEHRVQQTSVTVTLPRAKNRFFKGFNFGFWNSVAQDTRPLSSGFGSELDYFAGWGGKIRGINLNAGFTYLDVFPLLKLPRGDVINVTATVSKTVEVSSKIAVEPYLFNALAAPVRGGTPAGGLITHLGTGISYKPFPRLTLSAQPHIKHDTGAFGLKEGYVFGSALDVAVKVGKRLILHPLGLDLAQPIRVTDHRKFQSVFGFGLDFSFGF